MLNTYEGLKEEMRGKYMTLPKKISAHTTSNGLMSLFEWQAGQKPADYNYFFLFIYRSHRSKAPGQVHRTR